MNDFFDCLVKEKKGVLLWYDSTLINISALTAQYTYDKTRCQLTGDLIRV